MNDYMLINDDNNDNTNIFMNIYIHESPLSFLEKYSHMWFYVYMYIHKHLYIYIYIYTYIYISANVYNVYIYVCLFICMHIYSYI